MTNVNKILLNIIRVIKQFFYTRNILKLAKSCLLLFLSIDIYALMAASAIGIGRIKDRPIISSVLYCIPRV